MRDIKNAKLVGLVDWVRKLGGEGISPRDGETWEQKRVNAEGKKMYEFSFFKSLWRRHSDKRITMGSFIQRITSKEVRGNIQ